MQTEAVNASIAARYPVFPSLLPPADLCQHRYCASFAGNAAQLDAVLRLRFDVFNLELGEGQIGRAHV